MHYADSFGPQWRTFARSQIDTEIIKESEIRFDSEIGWQEGELKNSTVVEFGSGAGRFIDIVSRRMVKLAIGIDATDAVDAAYENLSDRDNVLFIQADIFNHPLRAGVVDFAYSIGVLHHTPEPELGFSRLVETVKPDGLVGLSLYDLSNYHRPNRNSLKVSTIEMLWAINQWRAELFRTVTARLPEKLFLFYCKFFVPLLHFVNKIPVIKYLRYFFPSTCYQNLPLINSMVDTHDSYATKIVHQYRGKDVFQWFLHEGLKNIILRNSRAGWVSITANVPTFKEQNNSRVYFKQPGPPGTTKTIS